MPTALRSPLGAAGALAIGTLLAAPLTASPLSAASQTAVQEVGSRVVTQPLLEVTIDMATGERTIGGGDDKDSASYVTAFENNDQSGRYATVAFASNPLEFLDWGEFSSPSGTDIISRLSFGYATNELDADAGGDGVDLSVSVYSGAQGGCGDGGLVPLRTLDFAGLPGSPDGSLIGIVVTVILSGGNEFCLPDGPFGFGFVSTDVDQNGFYSETGPLQCFAGDLAGNPQVDPDANGQVNLVDVWESDVTTGVCQGSINWTGTFNDASFLLVLETPDPAAGPMASATFENGTGVNPASYSVTSPPVLGGYYSGLDSPAMGGTGVFLFGYERGLSAPLSTPFGELLLDPSSTNVLAGLEGPYLFGTPNLAVWSLPVPCDLTLCGTEFRTQTMEFGAGFRLLHNAQDLVVGF